MPVLRDAFNSFTAAFGESKREAAANASFINELEASLREALLLPQATQAQPAVAVDALELLREKLDPASPNLQALQVLQRHVKDAVKLLKRPTRLQLLAGLAGVLAVTTGGSVGAAKLPFVLDDESDTQHLNVAVAQGTAYSVLTLATLAAAASVTVTAERLMVNRQLDKRLDSSNPCARSFLDCAARFASAAQVPARPDAVSVRDFLQDVELGMREVNRLVDEARQAQPTPVQSAPYFPIFPPATGPHAAATGAQAGLAELAGGVGTTQHSSAPINNVIHLYRRDARGSEPDVSRQSTESCADSASAASMGGADSMEDDRRELAGVSDPRAVTPAGADSLPYRPSYLTVLAGASLPNGPLLPAVDSCNGLDVRRQEARSRAAPPEVAANQGSGRYAGRYPV